MFRVHKLHAGSVCIAFLLIAQSLQAQSVLGLWTIDEVKVGDETLTPVAKWFHFHPDHSYEAGNGWTRNDAGTWEYDTNAHAFVPVSRNGDEGYGPFNIEFQDSRMVWERIEDGMPVKVFLSRIDEMPMAPKDSVAGNWALISVLENGTDISETYDPERQETLLVRWTGTYRKRHPDGSQAYGYWHMDPHVSEFHLIDFNREIDVQVYSVAFTGDVMKVVPKGNEGRVLRYQRR